MRLGIRHLTRQYQLFLQRSNKSFFHIEFILMETSVSSLRRASILFPSSYLPSLAYNSDSESTNLKDRTERCLLHGKDTEHTAGECRSKYISRLSFSDWAEWFCRRTLVFAKQDRLYMRLAASNISY